MFVDSEGKRWIRRRNERLRRAYIELTMVMATFQVKPTRELYLLIVWNLGFAIEKDRSDTNDVPTQTPEPSAWGVNTQ